MKIHPGSFRTFCTEKWYEHKDEKMDWERTIPSYGIEEYFHRNKWLLKRMFIEQLIKENHRKIQKEVKRGFKKGNL
jgi:hypothetical protein